ncbi:MAG TPA: hypothetical protein VIN08_18045 [Ohtaekwangia sp.]|uniref:hypothetical protein n=1 Tax=Ohtaekwangia sp. TaxID=2066019 RepID=UPI002F941214
MVTKQFDSRSSNVVENMKIEPTNFKGIEYVQVSQLPEEQQAVITQSINNNLYIKILIDGKIVGKCLQYKDYELWYNSVYRPGGTSGKKVVAMEDPAIQESLLKK